MTFGTRLLEGGRAKVDLVWYWVTDHRLENEVTVVGYDVRSGEYAAYSREHTA